MPPSQTISPENSDEQVALSPGSKDFTDTREAVPKREYTWDEIKKHNHWGSCWIVIHGYVYDTTPYLKKHPGGEDMMLMAAGRASGTELFELHHPSYLIENTSENKLLQKYLIGKLKKKQLSSNHDTTSNTTSEIHHHDHHQHYHHHHDHQQQQQQQQQQKEVQIRNEDVPFLYNQSNRKDFYVTLKKRVETYFKKHNLKPRDNIELYAKTLLCWTFWILCYYFMHFGTDSIFYGLIWSFFYGLANANIGMSVMHDGNHGGFSNSPLVNRIAGGSFDILGGSSYVWKMIHSVGHHVHTNVEEKDPDIYTHDPHFRRIKKQQRQYFWYPFQHIYLPILYTTLLFELFLRDFVAMGTGKWGGLKFQPVRTREWVAFGLCKLSYLFYNFIIPAQYHSIYRVVLLYTIGNMIASELLVMMFQVNHVTEKTKRYHVDQHGIVNEDWAVSQVCGTSNFASGSWLWNHISGGLNHQIEHHLFPTVSHIHYTALHPIVKQTCLEYGLPYHNYSSFWTAIGGHMTLLRQMGSEGKKIDYSIS